MAYSLIHALKTSSVKTRSEAAKALSRDICEKLDNIKTETDYRDADLKYPAAGYRELVKMASGGRRRWLRWYQYEDALYGIEALAETSAETALELLENWYLARVEMEKGVVFLDFPNAPKGLKERLSQSTICQYNQKTLYGVDDIKKIVTEREPHRTFVKAIKRGNRQKKSKQSANSQN